MPKKKTAQKQTVRSTSSKHNSNHDTAYIGILILGIIIGVLGFLTYQYYMIQPVDQVVYTPDVQSLPPARPIPTASPDIRQPVPNSGKTYVYNGYFSANGDTKETAYWNSFKLHLPQSWSYEEHKDDVSEANGYLAVKFTRSDGSFFDISRGEGDYGLCVFKDEVDYNTDFGQGGQFENYETITNGQFDWRLADNLVTSNGETINTHTLCEKATDSNGNIHYFAINKLGTVYINLKTPQALAEFKGILQSSEL